MTGTWRIDYRNADDRKPEFFGADEQRAMARAEALKRDDVQAVVWYQTDTTGPWVEPVTQISTRFEGDNWTALGEGA